MSKIFTFNLELKETINLLFASLVFKMMELQVQQNDKTLTFLCINSKNVKTLTLLGIKSYFSVVSC